MERDHFLNDPVRTSSGKKLYRRVDICYTVTLIKWQMQMHKDYTINIQAAQ